MRKLLDKQTELDLVRAWKDHRDEKSLARLIEAFQPMIISVASRYMRGNLELEDLIQEGTAGFIAGLENFDPNLGYRVSSLTRYHVANYTQVYALTQQATVPLPKSRRMRQLISKVVVDIQLAEEIKGEQLTDRERISICEHHGFTLDELETFERVVRPTAIISQSPCEEEGKATTIAANADVELEASKRVDEELFASTLSEIMTELDEVDGRAQQIVLRRHVGDKTPSYAQIGDEIGISGERVRHIEKMALAFIKERLIEAGISGLEDFSF